MVAVMAAIIATLTWSFIFWRERQMQIVIA